MIYRPKKTQSKLLAGAIVIKRTLDESTNPSKKTKLTIDDSKKSPQKSTGLIILQIMLHHTLHMLRRCQGGEKNLSYMRKPVLYSVTQNNMVYHICVSQKSINIGTLDAKCSIVRLW